MRSFHFLFAVMWFACQAFADVPIPYRANFKISRELSHDAFKENSTAIAVTINEIYQSQCDRNLGASNIVVVTDAAPADQSDAENSISMIKEQILDRGFPKEMIFSSVFSRDPSKVIYPNIFIDISCRRKYKE